MPINGLLTVRNFRNMDVCSAHFSGAAKITFNCAPALVLMCSFSMSGGVEARVIPVWRSLPRVSDCECEGERLIDVSSHRLLSLFQCIDWLRRAINRREASAFPECDTISLLVSPGCVLMRRLSLTARPKSAAGVLCNFSSRKGGIGGEGVWDLHFKSWPV